MSVHVPLCRACSEVIGVYEPMIVLCEGEALATSRAAQYGHLRGELYHRDCYAPSKARPAIVVKITESIEQSNEPAQQENAAAKDGRQ